MFLDGVSIFLIFLPLLYPLMLAFQWDPVWFGVLLTMKVAIGQFTPPMAVNLMVACRLAGVRMEQTRAVGRLAAGVVRAAAALAVLFMPAARAVAAAQPGLLMSVHQRRRHDDATS